MMAILLQESRENAKLEIQGTTISNHVGIGIWNSLRSIREI